MYGESLCSSSATICLRVTRITNSFMSRQNADDGMRLVPAAHGATCEHLRGGAPHGGGGGAGWVGGSKRVDWAQITKALKLRTNFTPEELEDLWQSFREIAGSKEYLSRDEFRRTIKRNFGIMKEEWATKYFRAFDRNDSGTIDFPEYVMGFAAMARVLTDKKAQSLIGLSTGANIVRSGRDARLFWDHPPRRVAVIKKWRDKEVARRTADLVDWLQRDKGLKVLLDPSEDPLTDPAQRFLPHVARFDPRHLAEQVDFMVTLGGDGTALKAASYFDDAHPIPPALALGLGSLGFLAPFSMRDARAMIERVLHADEEPMACTLRTRLRGDVYSRTGTLQHTFYSLNEFIVNRGLSGVLSTLEVYVDGQLVTTAQGDGLIVATPSGSTAYNISAGGCMVSPLVPATLITPIAPHSLSFRPILTSASSEITVRIPETARADGWMSYDATASVAMEKGSYVRLSTAQMPFPTLNLTPLDGDWFQSIREKLHWNVRTMQKPLDALPTPPLPPVALTATDGAAAAGAAAATLPLPLPPADKT
ncbi:ATP-NAD kinase-like domain-containing protein [Tribonema minus]|uniref:ATP-NAD kinase-like domain-containing protein n=1 Tax=Tribonema minus TaxID=303371 RepID=A0A835Z9J6_9STRA|nr:ATP-NAD kinase-like domain-containing protein [Tribonema minus]